MEKKIKNYQLFAAISSVIVAVSYFAHFITINLGIIEPLFDKTIGNIFQLFSIVNGLAENMGMGSNYVFSMLVESMGSEAISIMVTVIVVTIIVPFIMSLISAVVGFVMFAKKRINKPFSIVSIVFAGYTIGCDILFAIGMAVAKSEMGEMADVVNFGFGYYVQWLALIATIVLSILLIKSAKVKEVNSISSSDVGIIGVCGMWKDAEFLNNSGKEIIIGRDPSQCDVVISENSEKVSRKHCSVNYDYKANCYVVTDFSSNGTYLDNGQKLKQGIPLKVSCGTVIILGNENNAFKLN